MKANYRFAITSLLVCAGLCSAQEVKERKPQELNSAKPAPSGVVTGHIYLDDTKAPARKATVYLEPATVLQSDGPRESGNGQTDGPVTLVVETRFDGSYAFAHVTKGSYYVVATCPGYISPFVALSLSEARSGYGQSTPIGEDQRLAKAKILRSLPFVEIESDLPVVADVVLERGSAVSGTVTYDDSGPAARLRVAVLARIIRDGKETWDPISSTSHGTSFTPPLVTDDRGYYRISGLPIGRYVAVVIVELSDSKMYISTHGGGGYGSNARSALLSIYSGSTPRQKEAVAFTLQAREERNGEDIVIPMSKLRTVTGNIVSAHDGHVVNSGAVVLLNADDHLLVASQSLTEEDPSFTLSFIFDGDYVLSSTGAADVDYVQISYPAGQMGLPQFRAHVRHVYGSASMPIHVKGDMDRVTIAVPEPTASEAKRFKDLIRQQEEQELGSSSQ